MISSHFFSVLKVLLPKLTMSNDDCIADLKLRSKRRLNYPGACSLEYQNLKEIIIETLFNWNKKEQKPHGPGIFGTVVAFAAADEEQGRKTLHMHVQLWVKDVNPQLRGDLYHKSPNERHLAREKFKTYVEQVMTTSLGPDLVCQPSDSSEEHNSELIDASPQILRDARHNELSKNIKGEVMQLRERPISAEVLIQWSLEAWREYASKDMEDYAMRDDTFLPMTKARRDIAAYTYSYHMPGGSNEETDPFWKDTKIRQLILTERFDHHEWCHRCSCFKKGCECRFCFPFPSSLKTFIHEDFGKDDENVTSWPNIDGSEPKRIPPWMIVLKRQPWCHYVNVHNATLSEVLNCNSNVQVGDPYHMYYITLYNLKSTQEEDGEKNRRIAQTIIRRLLRIQDEVDSGKRDRSDEENDFVEGLCRMLGGMNAATSRYIVSSTMAHLLICQGGTRFQFSHDCTDLLVGQLEAALEGKPVDFRLRVNRHKKKSCLEGFSGR